MKSVSPGFNSLPSAFPIVSRVQRALASRRPELLEENQRAPPPTTEPMMSRKRAWEEGSRVPMSSSSRRRVQPPPPPPPPLRPEPRPGVEEATRYIAAAEREFIEFAGKPDMVEVFHAVLDDYRLGRLNVAGVADRMELVLLGHPYLIRGINKFMPRGYVVRDLYHYY